MKKKLLSLVLTIILSLNSLIMVCAQEQKMNVNEDALREQITTYIFNLSDTSKESFFNSPIEFVENDTKLNEYISQLSAEDKEDFYSAMTENIEYGHSRSKRALNEKVLAFMVACESELALYEMEGFNVGYHTAEQAIDRGISAKELANLLAKGRKYVDLKTGAKIVYDKALNFAVVIDESLSKTITTYKNVTPGKVWRWALSKWKW